MSLKAKEMLNRDEWARKKQHSENVWVLKITISLLCSDVPDYNVYAISTI